MYSYHELLKAQFYDPDMTYFSRYGQKWLISNFQLIPRLRMFYCIVLFHIPTTLVIINQQFSHYFNKQMNLQEIFCTQKLCT